MKNFFTTIMYLVLLLFVVLIWDHLQARAASGYVSTTANLMSLKGTGTVPGTLKLYNADNTHYMSILAPILSADLVMNFPSSYGSAGQCLATDGAGNLSWGACSGGGGGSGTVTRVALSADPIFQVTGSPVTVNGTLGFTLISQQPNKFLASPTGVLPGTPTFRYIVSADLPAELPYANPQLSNLSGVTSVNLDLLPNVYSRSIGSSANPWSNVYSDHLIGTANLGYLGIFGNAAGTAQITMRASRILLDPNGGSPVPLRFGSSFAGYVGFVAPGSVAVNTIWTLPDADGTSGQCLSTSGAGVLSWVACSGGGGGGTVTNVGLVGSSDFVVTGSPVTSVGSFDLALGTTGVAAGTYGDQDNTPTFTVDDKGRLTSASSVPTGGTLGFVNRYLSNLVTTTEINAGLTFDSDLGHEASISTPIRSVTKNIRIFTGRMDLPVGMPTGGIQIHTGDSTSPGSSYTPGSVHIETGFSSTYGGGDIRLQTGGTTALNHAASGAIYLRTAGTPLAGGGSGNIDMGTESSGGGSTSGRLIFAQGSAIFSSYHNLQEAGIDLRAGGSSSAYGATIRLQGGHSNLGFYDAVRIVSARPTLLSGDDGLSPSLAFQAKADPCIGLSCPGVYLSIDATGTTAVSLQLPNSVGSAGQVLTTDGSGIMSWTTPVANPLALYSVCPTCTFTGIQAAIDQAVLDGHVSRSSSAATVVVYPKAGCYVEDLSLRDGISVVGASNGKGKDYTVCVSGGVEYLPQSTSGLTVADVTLANLYVSLGAGKQINLSGENIGRLWLKKMVISKTLGSESLILLNGAATSIIEYDDIDGSVTSASGPTIYDIQSGIFRGYNAALISPTTGVAGKILNVGAAGTVTAQLVSSCTDAACVTTAAGSTTILSMSSITNNQANGSGITNAGGTLTVGNTMINVPTGTGYVVGGTGLFAYSQLTFGYNANNYIQGTLTSIPLQNAPYQQVTLVHNTSVPAAITGLAFPTLSFGGVHVKYSMTTKTTGLSQEGEFVVVQNKVTPFTPFGTDHPGAKDPAFPSVTFSTILVGGYVVVLYTTTSPTDDILFDFTLETKPPYTGAL